MKSVRTDFLFPEWRIRDSNFDKVADGFRVGVRILVGNKCLNKNDFIRKFNHLKHIY